MNNQKAIERSPKFSQAIQTQTYQKLISDTLGDIKRSKRFIASISSAVSVNPQLQQCTPGTILSGALLGECLNLSPSPQLGQFYLVPFNDRKNNVTNAQFLLGYKGYIQLAIRSGQYKKLNVIEIKDGELVSYDPLNEDIICDFISDYDQRKNASTVGYYAMFEYVNGFKKSIFWSKSEMEQHADRYSPAFNIKVYHKILNGEIPDNEMWKYSSFWYKSFDDMAKKTMLRQLISKWGIMSTDMVTAFEHDTEIVEIDNDSNFKNVQSDFDYDTQQVAPEPQKQTIDVDFTSNTVDLNDL